MNQKTNSSEGSDALIHLRIPASMKARWVAESRKLGLKLTDWVVQKIEGEKMKIYKIPDALEKKYHGSGHALAAIAGGVLVDIVYIEDVLDDFDNSQVMRAIIDERLAPIVRELSALGEVSVGMCSCWEFCEL